MPSLLGNCHHFLSLVQSKHTSYPQAYLSAKRCILVQWESGLEKKRARRIEQLLNFNCLLVKGMKKMCTPDV